MASLNEDMKKKMREKGIDVDLSQKILDNYNAGKYDHFVPIKVSGIPAIDGKKVIDVTGDVKADFDASEINTRLHDLGLKLEIESFGRLENGRLYFDSKALEKLGEELYPLVSYGVLNGGSASSYVDLKKNKGFNETLFGICEEYFDSVAQVSKGKAKGITPAFVNQDGSHGPTFLELKMRALLIQALSYQKKHPGATKAMGPMFQMTSVYNDDQVAEAYSEYAQSEGLKDLMAETGITISDVVTGIQPMLSAFTHSAEGKPKGFFTKAEGREGNPLPMPGGHGQNFIVLKEVYQKLYNQGIRYVYLGNVDNLGFTVNPLCLALLALSGKEAGFDFSFRTQVDVKGGVLVTDQEGKLNCADIGPAISKEELFRVEKEGKAILFNCATGLFNLEYLVKNIDAIIEGLPMRFTDQDKDAGKYSQAEQVTWEVIGILDDFMIFGVDKYTRFLASKLLLEGLMTSGIGLDNPAFPTDPDPAKDLKGIAKKLSKGLADKLQTIYGMKHKNRQWVYKSVDELKAEL
ncbi:MAG: UTP--glucose-1-phosphate uridylyltransferase [Spirochaetales bacterium]|nr:UTP--glucose-1-phosphate uridylyltransferase [Spirochaetales bacterium]